MHLINLSPWYWSTGTMIYTGFSQVSIYLHFSIFCWGYLVAGSGLGLGQLARAIRMARAVRCGPEIRFIKMICRMLRRMIRMLRHLRQTFSSASENQTWSPSTQRYDSCKDSWRTKLYRVKALTVGRGRGFFLQTGGPSGLYRDTSMGEPRKEHADAVWKCMEYKTQWPRLQHEFPNWTWRAFWWQQRSWRYS